MSGFFGKINPLQNSEQKLSIDKVLDMI